MSQDLRTRILEAQGDTLSGGMEMVNLGVPRGSMCSLPASSVALRTRRLLRELIIQPHSADRETGAQRGEGTGPNHTACLLPLFGSREISHAPPRSPPHPEGGLMT